MSEETKKMIKQKLTSRKLWLSLAAFVAGLIMAFSGSNETAETVSGCIMSAAAVIAYAVGEGLADAGRLCDDNKSDGDNKNGN